MHLSNLLYSYLIYFTLVGSTHIFLLYEVVLHALLSRCSVVAPFASLTSHGLALQKVSCCCCSRCMYLPSLTRCPVYVVHLLSFTFSRLFGSGSGLCCVIEMHNSTFLFGSASSSVDSLPFPRCVIYLVSVDVVGFVRAPRFISPKRKV